MHYAIIAAGEGSRLRQEGISQDKPLVPIQGQPMIDRLIGIMCRCQAESISVICNSAMPEVVRHLQQIDLKIPFHLIVRQTPSSMHSLACLSEVIPKGKVCVTTVDTIFRESDFAAYVDEFIRSEYPLFAVTPFVDDEKPLWISLMHDCTPLLRIKSFSDQCPDGTDRFVSGGIYGLDTRSAWPVLRQCLAEGQSRMRNYQRALLAAGQPIRAYIFDRIMDIDHAADLQKAEAWLQPRRILAVSRGPEHSPNNVRQDAAILQAVSDVLQRKGAEVVVVDEAHADASGYDFVLHMARRMTTLTRLSQSVVPVMNDPRRVMQVAGSREYVLSMLQLSGVRVPEWWAYDPEEDEMFQCDEALQRLLPGWVKATRPDGARPSDVAWVETPLDADSRIIALAADAVPDIVVTRHVEGDLIKVYCVGDTWFRTFYPQEIGYTKFGMQEQHNSPLRHTSVDQKSLMTTIHQISVTLGLVIFGFDAIVGEDGRLTVIDVNDWPSFSICREDAAEAIANLVLHTIESEQ